MIVREDGLGRPPDGTVRAGRRSLDPSGGVGLPIP
jgi:hypothetical protein